MNWIDKLIDASFVFLGVLVAFMVDQYKEDTRNRESLRFNMEQILRDLPDEKPDGHYLKLKLKRTMLPNGACQIDFERPYLLPVGEFYLETISQNDLGRFLENRSIIPMLLFYYRTLFANAKDAGDRLFKSYEDRVSSTLFLEPESCPSEIELNKVSQALTPLYRDFMVKDLIRKQMGFQLRERLLQMGFQPQEREAMKIQITPKEVESQP